MKNFIPLSPRETIKALVEQEPKDINKAIGDMIDNEISDIRLSEKERQQIAEDDGKTYEPAGEEAFNSKSLKYGI